jgi:hypothetical protein
LGKQTIHTPYYTLLHLTTPYLTTPYYTLPYYTTHTIPSVKRSAAAADIAYQLQKKKYDDDYALWRATDDKMAEAARTGIMAMLYCESGWLCNIEGKHFVALCVVSC